MGSPSQRTRGARALGPAYKHDIDPGSGRARRRFRDAKQAQRLKTSKAMTDEWARLNFYARAYAILCHRLP
jgi:hypothetical protein